MILVVTSYLLALFHPHDRLHQRAVVWSTAFRDAIVVTEYVLWEVVNTLSKPPDRPTAHEMVTQVRGMRRCIVVSASKTLLDAGPELHRNRPDKEWSLTDCISFIVMEQQRIGWALTYDHHFEQAGFEALLRRDP